MTKFVNGSEYTRNPLPVRECRYCKEQIRRGRYQEWVTLIGDPFCHFDMFGSHYPTEVYYHAS